jgi:Lon protease-like protein
VRLPIFPLGLVLFPDAPVPLHLFEPRYRQMLADIRAGDSRFVILPAMPGVAERALPAGRVGCVAEVTDVEMLPDGRAHIVIVGRERVVLDRFVEDPAPYHVAEVAELDDVGGEPPIALAVAADEVVANFRRVVRAAQQIDGETPHDPTLPSAPARIPWAIAGMIDLDTPGRYRLLAERSPVARLAQIDALLKKVLPELELRAAMQRP